MGIVPVIGAVVIIAGGVLWYRAFGRSRASRESASLDALRIRSNDRLVAQTQAALTNPGANHVLVLTWRGMRRERLREILQIAGDLTSTGGTVDVSRLDRGGEGDRREERAWTAEIDATARACGITLGSTTPSAIREDHQTRISEAGIDLLLAEMPSNIRANRPFIRDLKWLRDNSDCDTIFFRNRGLEEIDTIVIMGTGGPYDALKISLADRIAERESALIRFVHVANEEATEAQLESVRAYHQRLHAMVPRPTESRVEKAEELVGTLARLSHGANLVILGAVAQRFRLFTDLADRIAEEMDAPALLVYANASARRGLLAKIIERLIY